MSNIEATKELTTASSAIAASPKQTWSHSTCTKEDLLKALHNKEVTAIESDIVMGTVIQEDDNTFYCELEFCQSYLLQCDQNVDSFH